MENAFTQKDGIAIPNNCTFHVTYEDIVLAEIHRQLIENMFELISLPRGRDLGSTLINSYMKDLSISLSLYVLRAALFFKHEAYKNEKEYRFLQVHRADLPPPNMKRRCRSYELVKYREFDWRRLSAGALKRIVIGPAADQSKAAQFVTSCLTASNIGDVEIAYSEIPYRAVD